MKAAQGLYDPGQSLKLDNITRGFPIKRWIEKTVSLASFLFGGIKVIAEGGWFAARPSRTEDIYKICAESYPGEGHLQRIPEEGQTIVSDALSASPQQPGIPVDVKERL